jgi:hypothetical protein
MRRGLFVVCLIDFSIDRNSQIDFADRVSNSAGNEMGRAAGKSDPALNTNSERSAAMFEAILSALTLIGYIVPQVLWAMRRGR